MKKAIKSICLGTTVLVLATGITACGTSNGGTSDTTAAKEETTKSAGETEATKSDKLSFAGDIVGQGVPALDLFVDEMQYVVESTGSEFTIYNDNFTADTQIQNVETMAAAGYDGLMIYGFNSSSLRYIADTCSSAKKPFVIFDQIPDKETQATLAKSEYYVGAVGADNFAEGEQAAKALLDDGCKKAVILGGSVGDSIHDARTEGFTKTFEEGGGTIVGAARCADPTEGTTKFDDLLSANPDVEGAYCLTGDYSIAAISTFGNHPDSDVKICVAGATTETVPYIKDGTIVYADSGSKIVVTISAALLKNYAMGNIIKDSEGNAPYFNNYVPFEVTPENVDQYSEKILKGHPLTEDEINELIGSDVTYAAFEKFIESYSID